MATGNINETNTNGVNYDLTYVTSRTGNYYNMVITDPGGTKTTVNRIPAANVMSANASGQTIGSLANVGTNNYVVPPTASGTVNIGATVAANITVYVGGAATINEAVSALSTTTIDVDGGSATLASGVLASALTGTTVNLENGGSFGNGSGLLTALQHGTVTFSTGGGSFDPTAGSTGIALLTSTTITGFDNNTDDIKFMNLVDPVDSYKVSALTGGSQTITLYSGANGSGTTIGSFTVSNSTHFSAGTFAVGAGPLDFLTNSGGDTTITVCFCAGTAIATPDGDVAVETLKAGDMVLTADGRTLPIRWMGQSHVARLFADPLRSYPIRITAGALGESLPKRDLRVSPEHAIFINGVLVQASALVNDETVLREATIPNRFTYYHVELATHELLLTEGVPTESFVDNVDRMNFHNWDDRTAPDQPIAEMDYPRAKSARQLPRHIRAQLLSQVAAQSAA